MFGQVSKLFVTEVMTHLLVSRSVGGKKTLVGQNPSGGSTFLLVLGHPVVERLASVAVGVSPLLYPLFIQSRISEHGKLKLGLCFCCGSVAFWAWF